MVQVSNKVTQKEASSFLRRMLGMRVKEGHSLEKYD